MLKFTVQHRYFSVDNGQPIGPYLKGDEVELEQGRAEWINRDSPGCLKEVEEKPRRGKVKDES